MLFASTYQAHFMSGREERLNLLLYWPGPGHLRAEPTNGTACDSCIVATERAVTVEQQLQQVTYLPIRKFCKLCTEFPVVKLASALLGGLYSLSACS